jgi:hypothetical protein
VLLTQWSDTNLAVVDWQQVTILGDEYKARQAKYSLFLDFLKITTKRQPAPTANSQLRYAIRALVKMQHALPIVLN